MKYKIKNPLGIVTCQLTPDSENEIIEALVDKKTGFCNRNSFFDALSDFDLIGFVDNIDDFHMQNRIDTFACNSTTLKDIQLITCFPLDASSGSSPITSNYNNKNALTLTMIRTCGDLREGANKNGLEYELEYAKKIEKSLKKLPNSKNIDFEIYGTLGIPNMILIQRGEDLSILLSNLTKINNYEQHDETIYFHTNPCIHREKKQDKWELTDVKGKVYWRIGISCYNIQPPTIISSILEKQFTLLKYFGVDDYNDKTLINNFITIDYTYGKRDVVIRPKDNSKNIIDKFNENRSTQDINFLGIILESISALGKDYQLENAIETKTELFIEYEKESVIDAMSNNSPAYDTKIIKPDLQKEFDEWYQTAKRLCDKELKYHHPQFVYGKRVTDLIERFQLTYNLPHMWEIVYDMKDHLEKEIMKLVESITLGLPEYPEIDLQRRIVLWYQSLEDDLQIFNFALDKRLAGVELGIGSRVVSNISGLGNFRTLLAAKAISHSLFRVANSFWDGFTIFSYNPLTSFLPNGIINMPEYTINDLVAWNQIGHETGHAYTIQKNLFETVPFLDELSNLLLLKNESGFKYKENCVDFLEELLADIFEYLFCYGGNFDRYRDTTWTNLDHDLLNTIGSDQVSLHLLRTICIFFIHLEHQSILEPGNSVYNSLGKDGGFNLIYQNTSIEEGIKKHLIARENNFSTCIIRNIIDPLIKRDKFIHIGNEIAKYDIEYLESVYNVIDIQRSNLLTLFTNPLRTKNKLNIKINDPIIDFERDNWNSTILKMKKSLKENSICKIDKNDHSDVCCLLIAIQELSKECEIDLSKNLAIILSLWDYYRQEFIGILYPQKTESMFPNS